MRMSGVVGMAAAITAAAITLNAVWTPPAFGRDTDRRGHCTMRSTWRLEADVKDHRIAVKARVDSNVEGQKWNWKILHNGAVSARGSAWTRGGGKFDIGRSAIDAPGRDVIGWRASNPRTGEHCKGNVTI
jgi:hypothetical protein